MMPETWLWPAIVMCAALALGAHQARRILEDDEARRVSVPGSNVLAILYLVGAIVISLVAWLVWAIVA